MIQAQGKFLNTLPGQRADIRVLEITGPRLQCPSKAKFAMDITGTGICTGVPIPQAHSTQLALE